MRTPTQKLTIEATATSPQLEAVTVADGDTPAVVAPPHPLYGGSIEIPAVGAKAIFSFKKKC